MDPSPEEPPRNDARATWPAPAPVPPREEGATPPPRRRRRWLALVPVVVLAVVMAYVRIPYFVLSPGPAEDVLPLIHVRAHPVYPPAHGHLLLTSVYETAQRVTIYQALRAWVDPSETVVPESAILAPGQTPQQGLQVALSQMDTSKIDAAALVLSRYAGYPKRHGPGALVEGVIDGTPAAGKLFAGDVITRIGTTAIDSPDQVGQVIRAAGVGHRLTFTVVAAGHTRTVTIAPAKPPSARYPIVGIYAVATFPFPLTIESGAIGGPSAGLMWSLGLVDLLTPGDLTHGRTVAGTGTISPDGTVGPIGGIEQKVVGAEHAGATVFFAPASEAPAARAVAHHITVVAVRRYTDALAYLARLP